LIIPVITLTVREAMMKKAAPSSAEFQWQLVPGSSKISTRFFSVEIKGGAGKLYEVSPPRVRLELRAKGSPISLPVSASYGFEEGTGDVQLRFAEDSLRELESNTVTLQIVEETTQKSATLHLLDAVSGVELARLDKIEMTIAF
jgi:hypothetical protein